ncbi:hypothetical protein KQI63_08855 [bacterium]|nr:hypothetical protein [bacterium]
MFVDLKRRFRKWDKETSDLLAMMELIQLDESGEFQYSRGWEELLERKSTIVLGEAGSGKSVEFKNQVERINSNGKFAFGIEIHDLCKNPLSNCVDQALFKKWRRSKESGYFFLDSLDEAKLRQSTLRQALLSLSNGIQGFESRIHIFISSRTSDWDNRTDFEEFSAAIKKLVDLKRDKISEDANLNADNHENIIESCFVLLPLDGSRVVQLAKAIGVENPSGFLDAIRHAGAEPLVGRPLDVEWMAEHWIEENLIGTWTEILEGKISAALFERHRERESRLSDTDAYGYAERIAGFMSLSNARYISAPGNSTSETGILPIDDLAADLELHKRHELVSRGVFDVPTFGRIKFHHEFIREYLAFKWLARPEFSRQKVAQLFFSSGEAHPIPMHLKAIAAWYCIYSPDFRRTVIRKEPELLFDLGDPQAISVEERIQILESLRRKYKHRLEFGFYYDRSRLARFSNGLPTKALVSLLEDQEAPDEFVRTILEIALAGEHKDLANQATQIALSSERGPSVRIEAINVVSKLGSSELLSVLSGLKNDLSLQEEIAASLIDFLFPGILTIGDVTAVLKGIDKRPRHVHTLLDSVITRSIPEHANLEQLIEIIIGVGDFVFKEDERGDITIQQGQGWLLNGLYLWVTKVVNQTSIEVYNDQLLNVMHLLFHHIYSHLHSNLDSSEFLKAVASRSSVKRVVIDYLLKIHPNTTCRNIINDHNLYNALSMEDSEWVLKYAEYAELDRASESAKELVWDIYLNSNRTAKAKRFVKQFNDLIPEKAIRYKRTILGILKYKLHFHRPRWPRYKHRLLHWKNLFLDTLRLLVNLKQIQAGNHLQNLQYLARLMQEESPSSYSAVNPERVRNRHGRLIEDAAVEGLKRRWRTYSPPLPFEKEEGRGTTYGTIVGLAGLSLEMPDQGLGRLDNQSTTDYLNEVVVGWAIDPRSLNREEITLMTRYAIHELNQPPKWFSVVAYYHPIWVIAALSEQIEYEFDYPPGEEDLEWGMAVFRKFPYLDDWVKRSLAAPFQEQFIAKQPLHTEVLKRALEVLMTDEYLFFVPLVNLASEELGDERLEPGRFAVWWIVFAHSQPQRATEVLRTRLSTLSSTKADQQMVILLDLLHDWFGDRHNYHSRWLYNELILASLIPLIHAHLRYEEDLEHEGGYSPSARDEAQTMRSIILGRARNIGGDKIREAFELIANKESNPERAEWFRNMGDVSELRIERLKPMTIPQVFTWESESTLLVENEPDLFRSTLHVLGEIKAFIENDDFSIRNLFVENKTKSPVKETQVQLWLAHELEGRSRGQFSVEREPEVDLGKKPDIRLSNPKSKGPISIEVKISSQWSGNELKEKALEEQVTTSYLKAWNSRHGILLICNIGPKKEWEIGGKKLNFQCLINELQEYANLILNNNREIEDIRVVGIDFN